eukprot:3288095-Lingulodinium_polyedra.AAC.1
MQTARDENCLAWGKQFVGVAKKNCPTTSFASDCNRIQINCINPTAARAPFLSPSVRQSAGGPSVLIVG